MSSSVIKIAAIVFAVIVFAAPLQACPSCQDAIAAAGLQEDGQSNLPAAYNASIYLMVGVPYLTLGVLGFLVYRGCKKNAEYLEAMGRQRPAQAGSYPLSPEG